MRLAALYLVVVCLVVGCGTGEEPAPVKPSAKAAGPIGTITGMVTNSQGRRVVSTTDPPVTGAIVVLRAWPKEMALPTSPENVLLPWNRGLTPSFQGVVARQWGTFVITDDEQHNIVCIGDQDYPRKAVTEFDEDLRRQKRQFFAPTDLLSVDCGVHATERSWLTVAPTPQFCPVDTEGRFILTHHFPAGDYFLHAVSPVHGVVKGKATIRTPGETVAVDFRFLAPAK